MNNKIDNKKKNGLKYIVSSFKDPIERKLIKEAIDNEEIFDIGYIEHLIITIRNRETEMVIEHNKKIAKSISFLEKNGYWANLSQIRKTLPDIIALAAKNRHLKKEIQEDTIIPYTKQMKWFEELGNEIRQTIMDNFKKGE